MKRSAVVSMLSMLLVAGAWAQTPGRIQTATRLVTIFTNLENQLMDAAGANNSAALGRLLADDFSQWTPQPPGSPVAREEWLKQASKSFAGDFRIRQMAVKDLGTHAAANFVLVSKTKAFFVVDIWQKDGTEWRLAERYLALVSPSMYVGARRPSGKD